MMDIKFAFFYLSICKKRAKRKTTAIFDSFLTKSAIFRLKNLTFAQNESI